MRADTEFLLLGPLEVRKAGKSVALAGARRRALVARLLVADRPLPAERLLEEVWDGRPPAAGLTTLHSHVSQLRKIVGADRLVHGPDGYQIEAATDEIDRARFEQAGRRGDERSRDGDLAGALTAYQAALIEWRGPALDGFADRAWAQLEARRLDERRAEVTERLIACRLEMGDPAGAVEGAEVAVATWPLRETLWAHLMLGLYRCHRQADALRAYTQLRELLVGELGISPSDPLVDLEGAILRHDPMLDWHRQAQPESRTASTLGFPARLERIRGVPFIGRTVELDRLNTIVKAAQDSDSRVALVAGEPGIGKTRLVAEATSAAHDAGTGVLYGSCGDDLPVSYRPFIEILTSLGQSDPAGAITRHAERLAPLLAARSSTTATDIAADAPDPLVTFTAVIDTLIETAAQQPLVIVVDDLHWADSASLRLFRYLVQALSGHRIGLIGTYRDTDIDIDADADADAPLASTLAALSREPMVERVHLAGLNAAELGALVDAMTGTSGASHAAMPLATHLRADTGGNPFLATELIRHASDARDEAVPPETVRDVVGGRIRRLGRDVDASLTAAAIIGRGFDTQLLAALTDRRDADLLHDLQAAVRAGLVLDLGRGRFEFVHDLIPGTLVARLGPSQREHLHRRTAAAMTQIGRGASAEGVTEIAYHWLAGHGPDDRDRLAVWSHRAGTESLRRAAPTGAVRWFAAALEALDGLGAASASADDETVTRSQVLIGLGTAMRVAGDPEFRVPLFEAAQRGRETGDHDTLVAAALALSRGQFSNVGEAQHDLVDVYRAALAVPGETDPATRAMLLANLATELLWETDLDERLPLVDEALDLARSLADPAILAGVIAIVYQAENHPSTIARRLDETAEAMDAAARTDDLGVRFYATFCRAYALAEAGDAAGADDMVDEMQAIAEQSRQPTLQWFALLLRAIRLIRWGEIEAGSAAVDQMEQLGETTGQPDALILSSTLREMIQWHTGELTEIIELTDAFAEALPGIAAMRAVPIWMRIECDRYDEARQMFERERARGFAMGTRASWLSGVILFADIAFWLDDVAAAELLWPMLSPFDGLIAAEGGSFQGAVSQYLGELAATRGHLHEANQHFGLAVAQHEEYRAPFHVARTKLAWGRSLSRSGAASAGRARQLLTEAQALADLHGCAAVARRARSLLAEPV